MDETRSKTEDYRVVYSERVRIALKNLVTLATNRGLKQTVLLAIKELDHRLRVYPQFGEPLMDLKLKPARLLVGVVGPLVARYFLDEEKRLVMVVAPITPMPHCGLDG